MYQKNDNNSIESNLNCNGNTTTVENNISNNTSDINSISEEDHSSEIIIIDTESECNEILEDEDDYSYIPLLKSLLDSSQSSYIPSENKLLLANLSIDNDIIL